MRQLIPIATLFSLTATASAEVSIVATDVGPSEITMTLDGAPLRASDLTLREASAPRSAAVHATSVRSYAEGNEAVALAIVYNGQEIYVGNDDLVPEEDPSRYLGVLKGMQGAKGYPF